MDGFDYKSNKKEMDLKSLCCFWLILRAIGGPSLFAVHCVTLHKNISLTPCQKSFRNLLDENNLLTNYQWPI